MIRVALVAAGLGVVGLAAGLGWLRLTWLVVTVTGPSMRPTLLPGDRVLVRRTALDRVRAGQIVVLANETGPIIKRVAAAPGDRVPAELAIEPTDLDPEGRVPPGRLVLVGDNRAQSVDSRRHGCYDGANLVGVAVRPLRRAA